MDRVRGLKSLLVDAVEHGSRAVERIQKETARRPFEILEQIPPIAVPARGIHAAYDVGVGSVHGMIRLVTRVVGSTLDVVIDVVEQQRGAAREAEAPPRAADVARSPLKDDSTSPDDVA